MADKTFIEVTQQIIRVNQDYLDGKITAEQAKTFFNGAQVVINAGRLMLDFAIMSGNKEQKFLKEPETMPQITPEQGKISKGCKFCKHFHLCDTTQMKCRKTSLEYFDPK